MDLQFNIPSHSPTKKNKFDASTHVNTVGGILGHLVVALEHWDLPLARLPLDSQGSLVKRSSEREPQRGKISEEDFS